MVWTDETIEHLKKLWSDGLTTGEIGRELGVSKNAVVGKAHRLGLKGRPSPIKRPKKDVEKEIKIRSVVDLTPNSCRWPIGDPRQPNFHFCGKNAIPGKPYCLQHAQVAYVSSSRSRDEDSSSTSSSSSSSSASSSS